MGQPATPPPQSPQPQYSSVTIDGKCPECPPKKKKKPKGRKPIFEIVAGVMLFVFLILSTSKKIEKEKKAAQQKEYIEVQPQKKEPKSKKEETPPKLNKAAKIDISNFSDLEQQYIKESCKGTKGSAKEKCVRKSINELLDLY